MSKSLAAVAVFLLIAITGILADIEDNEVHSTYMYQGVKMYTTDRECAMVGGSCVQRRDCLQASSKSGLCPSNSHIGVECCYELFIRPAPCQQHLGECKDRCPRGLRRPGTDCGDEEYCCVLI